MNYTMLKEIKNTYSLARLSLLIFMFFIPYIYFFIQKDAYALRDNLDMFTFMLEDPFTLIFAFLAQLVYVLHFSNEVKDRFLVYTRSRISIKQLMLLKLKTNVVVTFSFFFLLIFSCFFFSFYLQPLLGFVEYFPQNNNVTIKIDDIYSRYTFSQLLQYGSLVYGLVYSFWIAFNAVLYASIGFFSVLCINNIFLGLSLPFLIYIIGTFLFSLLNLVPFSFAESIFPFSYMQQPMWESLIPCLLLIFINIFMYRLSLGNLEELDRLT